jgi:hypothetical protein
VTVNAQQKAAFRRWARENHPDVGGDPAVFAAGVRAAREGRWRHFSSSSAGGPDFESRPIVYVRRSVHGVARFVVAAKRWNDRRRRPPRVH